VVFFLWRKDVCTSIIDIWLPILQAWPSHEGTD
jgi:hypothetical protein